MELATAMIKMAEVASRNGGTVPLELAMNINKLVEEHRTPVTDNKQFIKECAEATASKALYGH